MMKKNLLIVAIALGLSATTAQADKPQWAGQGAKPSAGQVEEHRVEMRDKNNDKAGPKGEQGNGDKEKSKDNQYRDEKQKQKTKEKYKPSADDHDRDRDHEQDRHQDKDRDRDRDEQGSKSS